MRYIVFIGTILLGCLFVLSACQLTQTPFARQSGDTGSTFVAAMTTLTDLHQGRLTTAYTRSAFENYRSQLEGLDQQLPTLDGRPDSSQVQTLLQSYKQGISVIEQPCLEGNCDWQGQVRTLQEASKAFLKAGGQ